MVFLTLSGLKLRLGPGAGRPSSAATGAAASSVRLPLGFFARGPGGPAVSAARFYGFHLGAPTFSYGLTA